MLDKILEKQGAFHGAEKTGKQGALGKDAFLKLLVTQLQHQDPLNPLDDKEFIAQLAQFSSLEQMNNISEGITSLVKKTQEQDMLNSVNYIGKEVTASGHSVTKNGTVVTPVFFTLKGAGRDPSPAEGRVSISWSAFAHRTGTFHTAARVAASPAWSRCPCVHRMASGCQPRRSRAAETNSDPLTPGSTTRHPWSDGSAAMR